MTHQIRPAEAGDSAALRAIAETSGLFAPEEMAAMDQMLAAWAEGAGPHRWLIEAGAGPGGAALLAPEEMSDNVWNTLFLAVRPERRRGGLARALIAATEAVARAEGGRMMMIDTASDPAQEAARATYLAAGYAREAVIRNYYGDGIDRVTFCRML